jgi:hypothetical protein
MAKNSRYDRFTLAVNDWGTIHPILDMAPPLLAKEEGPLTKKELNLGILHTNAFPHCNSCGQEGSRYCRPVLPPPPAQDEPGHLVASLGGFQHREGFTGAEVLGSSGILCLAQQDVARGTHTRLAIVTQVLEYVPSPYSLATLPRQHI